MSELANLSSFQQKLINAKTNKDSTVTGSSRPPVAANLYRGMFATTSTGPNSSKIYKNATISWADPGARDNETRVMSNPIRGVRGFILRAVDGYILNSAYDPSITEEENLKQAPTCSTISAKVKGYELNGSTPSPMPLSKWQSEARSNNPKQALVDLELQGSRGESCADCVLNGHNIEGKTSSGADNRCSPRTNFLFGVTHYCISSGKTESGLKWIKVEDAVDEDGEKLYTEPVIIYVENAPSLHGTGGKTEVYSLAGKLYPLTQGNGGPSYIPNNSEFFFPYWNQLANSDSILYSEEFEDENFPIHPTLPYIVTASTEMYLTALNANISYANAAPVFTTVDDAAVNEEVLADLFRVRQAYINTYEQYIAKKQAEDKDFVLPYRTAPDTPKTVSEPESNFEVFSAATY